MARVAIVGAETGDLSEIVSTTAGMSVDGSTFNSAGGGAYAYKFTGNTGGDAALAASFGVARAYCKCYFRFDNDTNPASTTTIELWRFTGGGPLQGIVELGHRTDGTMVTNVYDSAGSFLGSSATLGLAKNTWYRFEADFTKGAGTGAISVYLDGTLIQSFSSKQFGSNNTDTWLGGLQGGDTTGRNYWFDDIEVDDAGLPGVSYVIARQFKAGSPTYDAWTKTTGNIESNWNDTPFNATNKASTPLSSTAQTALIAAFNATQSGHGNGTIAAGDTLNGAKFGLVGKTAATTGAGITEVGTAQSGSSTAGANITLTFSTAPQAGDVVLVFGGFGTAGANNPGISTAGYTNLFADNATAARRFGVWYKVMGATPDTTVVGLGSGTALDGVVYLSIVLRQLSNDVVIDIAVPAAATGSSTNPNPPASGATATANTWVLSGACSAVNDTSKGTQTNYTQEVDGSANGTRAFSAALSHRLIAAAATNEDPPAYSSWATGAWEAVTVTVRPASQAGSAASIRRRLGGADTDTAITLTTSDAYYETAVIAPSYTDLNAGEVGVLHGNNSLTQTVEDAWAIASYTPAPITFFHNQAPVVPQHISKPQMVGY